MGDAASELVDRGSDSTDEPELVAALRAGDADAFESVMRRYGGQLLAVATRILGNETDAQDALQEGLINAFRAIDRFEGQSKLSTWLYRIVVNAALKGLRTRSRRPAVSLDQLLPTYYADGHRHAPERPWSPLGDDELARDETRRQLRDKIHALPDDARNVIILRDIEGLDTEQAATVLDIEPGAVRTRLHRARQALRTMLEESLAT